MDVNFSNSLWLCSKKKTSHSTKQAQICHRSSTLIDVFIFATELTDVDVHDELRGWIKEKKLHWKWIFTSFKMILTQKAIRLYYTLGKTFVRKGQPQRCHIYYILTKWHAVATVLNWFQNYHRFVYSQRLAARYCLIKTSDPFRGLQISV